MKIHLENHLPDQTQPSIIDAVHNIFTEWENHIAFNIRSKRPTDNRRDLTSLIPSTDVCCAELCPDGTEPQGADCVTCPKGTYRTQGVEDMCTDCPDGPDGQPLTTATNMSRVVGQCDRREYNTYR